MSNHIETVKNMYAAFSRGDAATILSLMADNVSWECEAPAELTWSGIRRGPQEAAGFFTGIAQQQVNPVLEMIEFVASGDVVAAFGRYQATDKGTGIRVDTPVAHYFKFDNTGKVVRYQNFVNTGAFVAAMQPAPVGSH